MYWKRSNPNCNRNRELQDFRNRTSCQDLGYFYYSENVNWAACSPRAAISGIAWLNQHQRDSQAKYLCPQCRYVLVSGVPIDTLYLDTTYLNPNYAFPSQAEVISFTKDLVRRKVTNEPKTLFVTGTYFIGKERIFLGEQICFLFRTSFLCHVRKYLTILDD